jgi:uncharacterized membrane protein (UPF0127 family)
MRSRALRWTIAGLVVVAGVVLLLTGANRPPDPVLREGGRGRVEGFGQIAFRVDKMASARRCALLAQNSEQRSKGLMGRTDLAGYDGMLFVFEEDTRGAFYMLNTPLPLSIAWFDSDGRFVSATDMEPCLSGPDCPLYHATGPYRYALEVPQGGLAGLGIEPGSRIEIGGDCP